MLGLRNKVIAVADESISHLVCSPDVTGNSVNHGGVVLSPCPKASKHGGNYPCLARQSGCCRQPLSPSRSHCLGERQWRWDCRRVRGFMILRRFSYPRAGPRRASSNFCPMNTAATGACQGMLIGRFPTTQLRGLQVVILYPRILKTPGGGLDTPNEPNMLHRSTSPFEACQPRACDFSRSGTGNLVSSPVA